MASEPVKIISFVSLIYLFPTVFTAFLWFHISWARTQIRSIHHEYIIYDPLIYISYQDLSSENLITRSTLHQYSFNRIFFRLNSILDVTAVAVYNLPLRRCMMSWSPHYSEAKQFVKPWKSCILSQSYAVLLVQLILHEKCSNGVCYFSELCY